MKDKPITHILFTLCILWTTSGLFYLRKILGVERFDRSIWIWILGVVAFMASISVVFKIEERRARDGKANMIFGGIISGMISIFWSALFLIVVLNYTREDYIVAYLGIPGVIFLMVYGVIQINDAVTTKNSRNFGEKLPL